jgi:hypothetical protein
VRHGPAAERCGDRAGDWASEPNEVLMSKVTKLPHAAVEQIRSHPEYPALKRSIDRLALAAVLRAAHAIDTDPRMDALIRRLGRLGEAAIKAGARLVTESLLRSR